MLAYRVSLAMPAALVTVVWCTTSFVVLVGFYVLVHPHHNLHSLQCSLLVEFNPIQMLCFPRQRRDMAVPLVPATSGVGRSIPWPSPEMARTRSSSSVRGVDSKAHQQPSQEDEWAPMIAAAITSCNSTPTVPAAGLPIGVVYDQYPRLGTCSVM